MRVLLFFTAFFAVFLCASISMAQTWQPLGPEGASFSGVVVDPANADNATIFGIAPTHPFVHRTTDGGQSWSIVGDMGDFYFERVVAYDYNTLYGCGMDNSVYRSTVGCSTDGGVTWSNVIFDQYSVIRDICVHPTDTSKVYLAGNRYDAAYNRYPCFYSSTDGGATWSNADLPTPAHIYPSAERIDINPSNPNELIVVGYQMTTVWVSLAYKSTDGGATWTDISSQFPGLPDSGLTEIVYDPSNGNNVHTCSWNHYFKSTDGGNTWTQNPSTSLRDIDTIAVDPTNSNNVYMCGGVSVSGCKFYKSTDAGTTWTTITGIFDRGANDQALAISAASPSTIYMATGSFGGGLFKSEDSGATWDAADSGIVGTAGRAIAVAPSTPNTLYIYGGDSQVWYSANSGNSFTELVCPPGCSGPANFQDIQFNPIDPDHILALSYG